MKHIEIKEECKIPGTDIILEIGDTIKVIEKTYYNAYWYDDVCSELDVIVTKALKDVYYKIPDVEVTASGEGSGKVYYAIMKHISLHDYKIFPKTYIKNILNKAFPNKKVKISSYTHPMLTLGNYEVTIALMNQ